MTRRLPALLALLFAFHASATPPDGARDVDNGRAAPSESTDVRAPEGATGPSAPSQGDDHAPEPSGANAPSSHAAKAREPLEPNVRAPAPRPFEPPRIPVRSIAVQDPRTDLLAAPGPAESIARELAADLPDERRALDRLLGLTDDAPIEIRVGYGREEFRSLQPSSALAPGWAAGVAYPRLGLVVLDAQASGRSGSVRGVLRHELAHVTLGRLLQTRIPNWLTEGFAMLYADEWTLSRSAVLVRASAAGTLIPLDDIDRSWPSSPSDVDLAYAQSANFVSFLAGVDDGAPFHRLVTAMAAGTPFDDAVVSAFGQPLVVHELAWKRTLRARFGWLPVILDHELLWGWAALLAVFGAWRLRRRKRQRLASMPDEPDETAPSDGDDDSVGGKTGTVREEPGVHSSASAPEEAPREDDFTTWTGPGSRLLH